MSPLPDTVNALLQRGVSLPAPHTVDVAPDVCPDQVARGAVIHAGCRLRGRNTVIGPGCVIGAEGPATVEDCQLGRNVTLAGGFFSGAAFLDDACFGSCAHVRPGTILEEQASCAHSVGLKQTLLMPFVVTGSLINFCDCLMAGGTSRKNHSEVGSSYIHFNFTPHGDKATASLIGDVPQGVRLDQPPIFLGGQGGLVGPVRIAFGTVIAAGAVWRKDVTDPGNLAIAGAPQGDRVLRYDRNRLGSLSRVFAANLEYIGSLHALHQWYANVRAPFFQGDALRVLLFDGAVRQLKGMIAERVKRVDELVDRIRDAGRSAPEGANARIQAEWPAVSAKVHDSLCKPQSPALRDQFLRQGPVGPDYIAAIQAMPPSAKSAATAWLKAEVNAVTTLCPTV